MSRSKKKGKRIVRKVVQDVVCMKSGKYAKYTYLDYGNDDKLLWEESGKKYKLEYVDSFFLSNPILNEQDAYNAFEYTKERDCVFFTELIGLVVPVYNGHKWVEQFVTKDVVLHQFGKFSYTRKRCSYKNKKKKKNIKR